MFPLKLPIVSQISYALVYTQFYAVRRPYHSKSNTVQINAQSRKIYTQFAMYNKYSRYNISRKKG